MNMSPTKFIILNLALLPFVYAGLYTSWGYLIWFIDEPPLGFLFTPFIIRESDIFEPGSGLYLIFMEWVIWPLYLIANTIIFFKTSFGITNPWNQQAKIYDTLWGMLWGLIYIPLVIIGATFAIPMLIF